MNSEIEKEKEVINSMRCVVNALGNTHPFVICQNAKSNMEIALARIKRLEAALSTAAGHLDSCRGYVPDNAYEYGGKESLKYIVAGYAAKAREVL